MRQNVLMRTHLQTRPMKKGKSAGLPGAEFLLRVSRTSKTMGQIFLLLLICIAAQAQRKMEHLNRGVVAVRTSASQVYVGWRMLGTDPTGIAFNVYRGTTKLNDAPITTTTNYTDISSSNESYYVRPIINGIEQAPSEVASVTSAPYLNVPLQVPPGGITLSGEAYTYNANDASVGDLDGDGEYEIVLKWDPANSKDNSQGGYTGNVFIDAYKLNGTRLWRIDLGKNIRAGAHYTQVMVYDLDSDGRAEVACRTSDGTIDGTGVLIGNAYADYRNAGGYVLTGPEYLTIFNGQTGKAMATTDYLPERGSVASWGDGYGNRVDRFVAGVAYLDGQHPSLVMGRGYYTRLVRVAWDWRNGQLTHRWTFDSNSPGNGAYAGQGNHQLTVGDMDGDGKDDICNGSSTIKSDGTGLWANGLGHGDALHMSDMDPDRAGQEVWQPYEGPSGNGGTGMALIDASNGSPIWRVPVASGDIGRALAADIDPAHKGYEMWGATGGLYNAKGTQIGTAKPSMNFAIWWDGDLSRELLDGPKIDKWYPSNNSMGRLVTLYNFGTATQNNSTKANPCLSADILGDWREEAIFRSSDSKNLLIFTTTIPTATRMYTLMHDPQYRLAIAWQNTAYNQPPHPGFYLGTDMAPPPQPNIELVSAKGIGDGNYLIKPVHSGLCLAASDTLKQESCDTTGVQVWQVSKQGNNGYQIYSLGAKKYVGYEQAASGSKVILTNEPSPALFRVIEADSGTFYIAPAADSSLVLSVTDGSTAAGQALQLVNSSANSNQKFTFQALGNYTDCNGDWRGTAYRDSCNTCVGGNTGLQACTTTLASGIYTFKTGSSFCVQAGDTITQQVCDTLDAQVWQITKVAGIYDIYSLPLQKYLSYSSTNTGALLALSNTRTQYRLEKAANGSFYLAPIENPKVVFDVLGDTASIGKPIQLAARTGSTSQQYSFEKTTRNIDCNGVWRGTAKIDNCGTCTGGNTGIQACNTNLVEGNYVIKPVNSGLCLTPGTTFSQQVCMGTETNGQLWRLTKVGGLYAISSLNTGKYLGYSQAAIVASLSLVDSSARKLFRMETAPSNGSFYVYPSENLKVRWDVANRLTTPGATVGLYNNGTSTNQRFLFQIVPQQATVALSVDSNRVYNGQASVATVTTIPANLPVKITYNGSETAPSNAGSYLVVATITHPAYKGTATDSLTISKALLAVTARDTNRTYGAENPTFSLRYSGFVDGESTSVVDSLPIATTAATPASVARTYPIYVSGGLDNNYAFVYQSATLTVEKATLTAVADDKTRTYGAANPALTIRYSGFMNGQDASVIDQQAVASTPATETSQVGMYSISVASGLDSNYAFVYQSGSLSIEKAELLAKADAKSRAFAEANPALTITYSGFVNGEEASVINEKPVASTTAALASPNGSYPITVSGGSDANYRFAYQAGTLTVFGQPTLKAQYRVKDGFQPYDKHIRPQFQLVNAGTVAVPYTALTIRYWYTKEGNAHQAFWCDYATLGTSKVKGTFVTIPAVSGANQYVQVSFSSSALLAAGRSSGEIQTRFNKVDWSVYNEIGDYSYNPFKTQFSDWNRVTVYYKGVLVWGVEPTSAAATRVDRQEEVASAVSISPNPSSTSFSIQTPGSFSYQIHDQLGNLVEAGKGENNVSVGKSLKAGLYVVHVFTATNYQAIKVIKQ